MPGFRWIWINKNKPSWTFRAWGQFWGAGCFIWHLCSRLSSSGEFCPSLRGRLCTSQVLAVSSVLSVCIRTTSCKVAWSILQLVWTFYPITAHTWADPLVCSLSLSLHIPCHLITQIYSFPRLCGISLAGFIFDPHHQTQKWTIRSFVYNNLFLCSICPSVMRFESFKGLVMWNDVVCLIGSQSESYSAGDLSKHKTYTEPFPFGPSMRSLQTDLSKFTSIALTLLFTEENNKEAVHSLTAQRLKIRESDSIMKPFPSFPALKAVSPSFSSHISVAIVPPRMFACMPNATKA